MLALELKKLRMRNFVTRLSLGLALFSFNNAYAQPDTITYSDGVTVIYEMLAQDSYQANPWSIRPGFSTNTFAGQEVFAFAVDMLGHYALTNDFELWAKAGIGTGGEGANSESPLFTVLETRALYTFKKKRILKNSEIFMHSTTSATGIQRNYMKEIPYEKSFRWEILGGVQYFQAGLDDPDFRLQNENLWLIGASSLNVQLGLAARWSNNLLYALNERVIATSSIIRAYAAVLVPTVRSVYLLEANADDFDYSSEEVNLGFQIGIARRGVVWKGLASSFSLDISRQPQLVNTGVVFTLGLTLGLGANPMEMFVD